MRSSSPITTGLHMIRDRSFFTREGGGGGTFSLVALTKTSAPLSVGVKKRYPPCLMKLDIWLPLSLLGFFACPPS